MTSNLKIIIEELDAIDGVVDQGRAIKHTSAVVLNTLQDLFSVVRRKDIDGVNTSILLSMDEIARILWLAENVKDRAESLDSRIDAVYDAVQDIAADQRASSKIASTSKARAAQ